MSNLAKKFAINPDRIRIRTFEYNGEQFKVRIPMTKEAEEMFVRVDNPPQELIDQKYAELSKSFIDKKADFLKSKEDIKYTDDDIIVGKQSIRELAKSQACGETRIVESIKLLVPTDGTNLGDITYAEINEEFPLPVQLSLVKKIAEVISPSYEDARKN